MKIKIPILPSITLPWREKFVRRHTPKPREGQAGYRTYRPCLRWEFGFSCCFCLLHETDFAPGGAERLALTHIEHFIARSQDESRRNDYTNCFYICCLCNRARGESPTSTAAGHALLNPCDADWSERFSIEGFELLPRNPADDDAEYTCNTYDLNDPSKIKLRRLRHEVIETCRELLSDPSEIDDNLLNAAENEGGQAGGRHVELAQKLSRYRTLAYQQLLRFRAIPDDYDKSCRCGENGETTCRSLPKCLQVQTWELEYPASLNS
jgi:hypothetical protein